MPPAKQPPKHRQCGVQSATERLYEQDPNLRGRHRRIEDECQNLIAKGYAQRVWRKLSTIQVIVHVVSKTDEEDISDEQIESQIEVLNQDYRKTNADAEQGPGPVGEPRRRPQHHVQPGRRHAHHDHGRRVRHRRRREVEGRRRRAAEDARPASSTSGSATSAAACSATRSSPAARPRPTAW